MKTLFTAILMSSALAFANDPNQIKTEPKADRTDVQTGTDVKRGITYGDDALTFSDQAVVDKLHGSNKKHIEMGNLAQTRASSNDVRKFGAKLVKDAQRFDGTVVSFAKANSITLGASVYDKGPAEPRVSGSEGNVPITGDSTTGNLDRSAMGYSGGTPNDITGFTGSAAESGRSAANTDDKSRTMAETEDKIADHKRDKQVKLDALRNLQGAEFDAQFLSNIVEGSDRGIDKLTGWKGMGDKKLDTLIDQGIKLMRSQRDEAQKLQQKVPASS